MIDTELFLPLLSLSTLAVFGLIAWRELTSVRPSN